MNYTTIIEKTFTRQELVKAQKVINQENCWTEKNTKNAENQIDNLLKKVKR